MIERFLLRAFIFPTLSSLCDSGFYEPRLIFPPVVEDNYRPRFSPVHNQYYYQKMVKNVGNFSFCFGNFLMFLYKLYLKREAIDFRIVITECFIILHQFRGCLRGMN